MKPDHGPADRTGQRGYVTLFILGIAVAAYLSLAGAMQASRCFQDDTRRHLVAVQQRAGSVALTAP